MVITPRRAHRYHGVGRPWRSAEPQPVDGGPIQAHTRGVEDGLHVVGQCRQRARLETGRTLPLGSRSLVSLVWPTTLGTQPPRGLPQGGTKNRQRCRTPSRATQRNRQPPVRLSGNAPFLTLVDTAPPRRTIPAGVVNPPRSFAPEDGLVEWNARALAGRVETAGGFREPAPIGVKLEQARDMQPQEHGRELLACHPYLK